MIGFLSVWVAFGTVTLWGYACPDIMVGWWGDACTAWIRIVSLVSFQIMAGSAVLIHQNMTISSAYRSQMYFEYGSQLRDSCDMLHALSLGVYLSRYLAILVGVQLATMNTFLSGATTHLILASSWYLFLLALLTLMLEPWLFSTSSMSSFEAEGHVEARSSFALFATVACAVVSVAVLPIVKSHYYYLQQ